MEATAPATKDIARFTEMRRRRERIPRDYVVLLGLDMIDLPSIIAAIEKGFSWKTFERLVKNIGLPADRVAVAAGIPVRTLRRRKTEGRFTPEESDRMLRLARVIGAALELFDGNRESAQLFLTDENTALGGVSPIDYARTELGANEVVYLVGRIRHGIFS